MMFVIYKGSIWELPNLRPTLFQLIQGSSPEEKFWIHQGNARTQVAIKDLEDYSIVRNLNALRK